MTLILLFFGLLDLCLALPTCEWAYLGGEYIALNICQRYLNEDEINSNLPSSYVLECNDRGNGLQYRRFPNSDTCNDSTLSIIESAFPNADDFLCGVSNNIDGTCPDNLYLIYRTYECTPNNTADSDSFHEYNLIANTCLFNHETQESQYITCTSSYYAIATYSGDECDEENMIDLEIIEDDECMEIVYCPIITSTEFFTTTATPITTIQETVRIEPNNCNFVNYDGEGHRTDVCHVEVINSELYSYEFICNDIGTTITYNYFYNTSKCDNNTIISYQISDEEVINFQCQPPETTTDTTCSKSDYMQLRMYETSDGSCSSDDLKTFDSEIMNEYIVQDIVIDYCLQDLDGNYCIYQCNNNNNHMEKGYFTITWFDNPFCDGPPINSSTIYNDIDCYKERITHMIHCDGVNNISYNNTDYIIDCNYFIDDYIGRPLDICADQIIGGKQYSYKYKCNPSKTGIDKYWYLNKGCRNGQFQRMEPTDYEIFNCDSQYSCYDIDNFVQEDGDTSAVIDDYNSMLVAKHYTNTSCNKSEDFYLIEYIVIDKCWPNQFSNTFSKVTCDENYYISTLYTSSDCNERSRFRRNLFEINDVCLWEEYREIIFCPNWKNASWIPPTLPITESPTIQPTVNPISMTTPGPIVTIPTIYPTHADLDCLWVNFNGEARRINVCNVAPYGDVKWSYMYKCKINGDGVVQNWFRDNDKCQGTPNVERDLTSQITDFKCDSDYICENYVKIMTYDTPDCTEEEDYFVTSESIVDKCFMDNYNESKLIKCNPNRNGYIVYEYHDDYCHDEFLWKITEIPQKICQATTQRVEFTEECISSEIVTTETPKHDINFTECNYFYNGLFGIPLDICQIYRNGGKTTSVMYKCDSTHTKIVQYQYNGPDCHVINQIGAYDQPYSTFYCYSDVQCHPSDILQLKWYENDTCVTDENFWRQGSVILNVCWPNYDDNTSAIILCDGENYIVYRYNNLQCKDPSFTIIEYPSGQCVDGNAFLVESGCLDCKYWTSSDGYAYPINHCYTISSDGHLQSFQFQCNADFTGIEQIIYTDNECGDNNDIQINILSQDHIQEINYYDNTLNELMTLQIYHNSECKQDELNWSQDVIIIDKCFETNEGTSKMVTCHINNNANSNAKSSFTILTYQDPNCQIIVGEETFFSGDCDENNEKTVILSCGETQSPTKSPTPSPTAIPTTTPTAQINTPQPSLTRNPTKKPKPDKDQSPQTDNQAFNTTAECVNFFGGGDVRGTDCKAIEALVWIMIGIVLVACGCCTVYWLCSDTSFDFVTHGKFFDTTDEDETDGYNSDDEDNTVDHPRVLIEPNGLQAQRSRGIFTPQSARKASVASGSTQSSSSSTVIDASPQNYRKRGILDVNPDDEEDFNRIDVLDTEPENDNAMSSIASPNVISSFNPGTQPSQQGFVGSSDDYDEYGSKRPHSSNPTTQTTSSNDSGAVSGNGVISLRNVQHVHPSMIVGRTIEIDNVPIDILSGVDISAMHSMSNHLQMQQRHSNSLSQRINDDNMNRNDTTGLLHGTVTSALDHSANSRVGDIATSLNRPSAPPGYNDNNSSQAPQQLNKQQSSKSEASVNSIVKHYIRGKTFFADEDAKTIADETALRNDPNGNNKHNAASAARAVNSGIQQQHARQHAMDMTQDTLLAQSVGSGSRASYEEVTGNDDSKFHRRTDAITITRKTNSNDDIGTITSALKHSAESRTGNIISDDSKQEEIQSRRRNDDYHDTEEKSHEIFRRQRITERDYNDNDNDNHAQIKIQSQKAPIISHLESTLQTGSRTDNFNLNRSSNTNDSATGFTRTLPSKAQLQPPPPPIQSRRDIDNSRTDNVDSLQINDDESKHTPLAESGTIASHSHGVDVNNNNRYNDDWDNPANQILATSIHGALSSALAHSVDSRADNLFVDNDNNNDVDDSNTDDPIGSLPSQSHGAVTSALAHSIDSRQTHTGHHVNNSLIDPLIDTPISHGALSSALAHSVIDSDGDDEDNKKEEEEETVQTGTVTSALAHSVNTRVDDTNQEDTKQDDDNDDNDDNGDDNDDNNDDDENRSYRPHASSSGTVHDL